MHADCRILIKVFSESQILSHKMSLYDLFIEDFERQHGKIDRTAKKRLESKRANLITLYLLDFLIVNIIVGKGNYLYTF